MRHLLSTMVVCMLVVCAGCTSSGTSAKSGTADETGSRSASDPLYSLTLMRQGSILLQQEQYREALKKFQEADRIAPGNATVHNMTGLCYLRLEEYDQAVASFNRSLDLIPSFTDARNNRGAAYLALGQYRLAEVDFLAVLGDSTYPHRIAAYYNLGMTYYRRGQLGAAEENFRKAVTATQPVYEAYVRLAEIAQDQNRGEDAIDLMEEARLRFPERTEASLVLGRLLVQLGRPDEARPYLEQVIADEPGSDLAREATALLGNR